MIPDQRERRRQYSREYWAEHADQINAQRREQYKTDSDYRAAHLVRVQRCQQREKNGHVPEPRPIFCTLHGHTERLYRCTEVARILGCDPGTIRRWLKRKLVPEPNYDPYPLFTHHQVDLMRGLYTKPRLNDEQRRHVSAHIYAQWHADS